MKNHKRAIINVEVPEELHTRFRIRCIKNRMKMKDVIAELVVQYLFEQARLEDAKKGNDNY